MIKFNKVQKLSQRPICGFEIKFGNFKKGLVVYNKV